MTSTNTLPAMGAPVLGTAGATNSSKSFRKRLRASSDAHDKPEEKSPSTTTPERPRKSISATAPATSAASGAAPAQPRQTKAAVVEALLAREGGASLEAMSEATNWQPHTCRAFLTGLRKKGREVIRSSDKEGKSIYLIVPDRPQASSPVAEQDKAESN